MFRGLPPKEWFDNRKAGPAEAAKPAAEQGGAFCKCVMQSASAAVLAGLCVVQFARPSWLHRLRLDHCAPAAASTGYHQGSRLKTF